MRRIILTALAVMLFGGVASADRWRGNRDSSRHSGGTVVRDHRHREPVRVDRRDYRDYRRDNRRDYRRDNNRRHVNRRPVYVNNGRYVFNGGYSRSYTRPVFRQRYYDYRYRPQVIIQNYDPVPGYVFVQGHWNWSGYEWLWVDGYWAPDPSYQQDYGVNVQVGGSIHYGY